MGCVSTEHRVTEPANFFVKSPPKEHTHISFLNTWRHSCLYCVVTVRMDQGRELKTLSSQKPLQTEACFLITADPCNFPNALSLFLKARSSVRATDKALYFLVSLKNGNSLSPITSLLTLTLCPSTPPLCSSTPFPTSSPGDDP